MFAQLKVACYGFRGVGSQIDRIEEGFRAEGCEVVTDISAADLVYANDSGAFPGVIAVKGTGGLHPNAKVIFTQLDLAPHLGATFPLARIKEQLSHADAITTISTTVQCDIRARLGVEATVVYNPIRGVAYRGPRHDEESTSRFLFVGRVNDPAKRAGLGAAALSILGYGWDDMVTVGREPPHYGGLYAGEVDDHQLSLRYAASTFLMCPTRHAFLGLPILEAMACGCIPVVCRDLDIIDEFLPADVFPEYRSVDASAPAIAAFVARFMQDNDAKAEFSQRVRLHYATNWADKLSPRGVAQAILNVYQTL